MDVEGVDNVERNGWSKWVRHWTGEENRHGDALNKYLYLSGRVNMREIEQTTQHLINDGFDIGTGRDPYKNFVYTSFQELATFVSHNRVALIAKKYGEKKLFKMCNLIAGDEMRHHLAYSEFVNQIFKVDPSEMMLAFQYMMKQKITMPAVFLRESGEKIGTAFEAFSDSAQRIGVYTASDYVDILEKLNVKWDIANINGLTAEAEKARDYLMKLPERMKKISERIIIPEEGQIFKWVAPALIR
jgi:acyl-[acyl-carrier-protein] desaturase